MSFQPLPQNPIFVVGYPRSGTTLLQALLSTQESIVSFPETHFFRFIYRTRHERKREGFIETTQLSILQDYLREMVGCEVEARHLSPLLTRSTDGYIALKDVFEQLVFQLLEERGEAERLSTARWLEKTPLHVFDLNVIASWYPEAQFIHVIRNPLFAISSRKQKLHQSQRVPWGSLAKEWNAAVANAETFAEAHPVSTLLNVHYEDLVRSTDGAIRRIGLFLNVEIDVRRLQDYRETSERLIQPWETHKADVRTQPISNTNAAYHISLLPGLVIQHHAARMRYYGYAVRYPILQAAYNGVLRAGAQMKRLRHARALMPIVGRVKAAWRRRPASSPHPPQRESSRH